MPRRATLSEEDRFIEALGTAPADEALRLVYADWLEERGDIRAEDVRSEVAHFQNKESRPGEAKGVKVESIDPVWAALVSRAPFGILVPGLTFSDTGPRITRTKLRAIEKHWGQPLLPDYAAFLLRYNGGRPSKPYLYSYQDHFDGSRRTRDEIYNEVRFFSTNERHTDGRPYHLLSVAEMFEEEEGQDEEFARMMPVGTLLYEYSDADDEEHILALVMDTDEQIIERIIEVEHREDGLTRSDDVYASEDLIWLLMQLCDLPEEE
jgi:uncharacterized protein (TIGR02996 family)